MVSAGGSPTILAGTDDILAGNTPVTNFTLTSQSDPDWTKSFMARFRSQPPLPCSGVVCSQQET
jgi:hypothetical protein